VFERLREFNVTVNPAKTKLGLSEVEYVGYVISITGTSITEEKRLKVLQFPLPETQKDLLQFIGVANYFRDHVPNMTEIVQSYCKGSGKLIRTPEAIARSYNSWNIQRLLSYKWMPPIMASANTCHIHDDRRRSPCGPLLQQSNHGGTGQSEKKNAMVSSTELDSSRITSSRQTTRT